MAPSGADAPGRGTAAAPFRTIQFAVNQSFSGDVILLAGGTYTFDAGSAVTNEPEVNQVVTISGKRLAIYGGYSVADGYTKSNPQANPTVVDGEGQRRGFYVVGRPARGSESMLAALKRYLASEQYRGKRRSSRDQGQSS